VDRTSREAALACVVRTRLRSVLSCRHLSDTFENGSHRVVSGVSHSLSDGIRRKSECSLAQLGHIDRAVSRSDTAGSGRSDNCEGLSWPRPDVLRLQSTLLIRKTAESKSIDLGLCKRLAQEACRRASAAESWATLVFGWLNRQQCALDFARELAELAEKERPSFVGLPPR
jgi:hypothetical protein